ncbi:MAG: ParB N-terminal domain-containing protein [Firmicutes bacterium]|nr:ParB N-terminal domain-containing protein [Bacillota bacterium]
MGKMTIGKKEYETIETQISQSELYFYEENPRIFSTISNFDSGVNIQEEIEKVLIVRDYVKELSSAIEQNGGLTDNVIIIERNEQYIVLEGNSRLAAYRLLAKKDPIKWDKMKCAILPADISEDAIFTLLGQFHIVGRKPWSVFEQAAYLHRQQKASNIDTAILAKKVGMSKGDVDQYLEVYRFMIEHNELREEKWSYFNEYLKSRGIKKYRQASSEIDEVFAEKVKSGEIRQAVDVRDKLSQIAKGDNKESKKLMQRFIRKEIPLDDAWEQLEATGKTGAAYKQIEKFRKLVTNEDVKKQIKQESVSNKSVKFELDKISKALIRLLKELEE